MTKTRSEILAQFRAKVMRGVPIIGSGSGTGISAMCAEPAGIDLDVTFSSADRVAIGE